jgi:Uma2 family endonuclease
MQARRGGGFVSAILEKRLMTTEELLALPKDGVKRWLIRGELREGGMTRHNRRHGRTETKVAFHLSAWLEKQPEPRGEVLTGEAGFRLRRDPDTSVGIDLAYISADLAAATPDDVWLIDGAPTLAVEILSPSNKWEEVTEKVREYLDAGVALVWVVDPIFHTVQVYRPDAKPSFFNDGQELTGDPHLPGFRVPVAKLFG